MAQMLKRRPLISMLARLGSESLPVYHEHGVNKGIRYFRKYFLQSRKVSTSSSEAVAAFVRIALAIIRRRYMRSTCSRVPSGLATLLSTN
jgi:hypothetical protein